MIVSICDFFSARNSKNNLTQMFSMEVKINLLILKNLISASAENAN